MEADQHLGDCVLGIGAAERAAEAAHEIGLAERAQPLALALEALRPSPGGQLAQDRRGRLHQAAAIPGRQAIAPSPSHWAVRLISLKTQPEPGIDTPRPNCL